MYHHCIALLFMSISPHYLHYLQMDPHNFPNIIQSSNVSETAPYFLKTTEDVMYKKSNKCDRFKP